MKQAALVALGVALLLIIALWIHQQLSKHIAYYDAADGDEHLASYSIAGHIDSPLEQLHLRMDDLEYRVHDLERLRMSLMKEIEALEHRRHSLQSTIREHANTIQQLSAKVTQKNNELSQAEWAVAQAVIAQRDALERNRPEVKLPVPVRSSKDELQLPSTPQPSTSSTSCSMSSCFDWIRCPITSGFSIRLYGQDNPIWSDVRDNPSIRALITNNSACLHVHLINVAEIRASRSLSNDPYWAQHNGHNVVLFRVNGHNDSIWKLDDIRNSKAAIRVGSNFAAGAFRPGFDVLIPDLDHVLEEPVWEKMTLLLPLTRKYLASFRVSSSTWKYLQTDFGQAFVDTLQQLGAHNQTSDRFCVQTCTSGSTCTPYDNDSCIPYAQFHLVVCTSTSVTSSECHGHVMAGLRFGTIPVLLEHGGHRVQLPFESDGNLDYGRAVIRVPAERLTELHFMLRSLSQADCMQMRRQGRVLYERYFASKNAIFQTALSTIRARLYLPAPPSPPAPVVGVFANWTVTQPIRTEEVTVPQADPDEYLGPVELPYASMSYQHNFSLLASDNRDVWNVYFEPHQLYPSLPFESLPFTEAQFHDDTDFGYRSIGDGWGGSGQPFSRSLGSNLPREQFTVVMLSYERELVLQASLTRLHKVPYLNKVIVVWNSPRPPAEDIAWPKLHVPIEFVTNGKNSLNNRFLPLKQIETDAVLSMDDDVQLTHAEIVLAFRIWRESRDRIVGFPGRFHAWDTATNEWRYNSNHSCQLSMVLTGASFYHRYYHYHYTNVMPSAIRQKVDLLTNCEDLAMNFLVSHLTRKPPLKVTSKWTFRCANCPSEDMALSADDSHFLERHECMQYFTRVYGYNPLLYTQYRVDSVLFKTRVPSIHQKCFKYV